jgi:hypothetical protein
MMAFRVVGHLQVEGGVQEATGEAVAMGAWPRAQRLTEGKGVRGGQKPRQKVNGPREDRHLGFRNEESDGMAEPGGLAFP